MMKYIVMDFLLSTVYLSQILMIIFSELFLYSLLLFSHKPNFQKKHYSIDTLTILIYFKFPQINSMDGQNVQFIMFLYVHFIIFKYDLTVYY